MPDSTPEQADLASTVRSVTTDHGGRRASRAALTAPDADRRDADVPSWWTTAAGLGWLGVHVPAALGGGDGELAELAVVAAELGAALVPGPFPGTVLCSALLARSGDEETASRWCPGLVDGSRRGAVALDADVTRSGPGVFGRVGVVAGGRHADVVAVPVDTDVVLLDPAAGGVTSVPLRSFDPGRPLAELRIDGAVPAGVLRGGRAALTRLARVLLAAEASGVARGALALAAEHARRRHQFGRPIGSFQAVKHRLADMAVASELATAAVWDAARPGTDGPASLAAAVAAVRAPSAALLCARSGLQVHGGIGFTWEHDAHLYLRRADTLAALLRQTGDPAIDVERLHRAGARPRRSVPLPPATVHRAAARSTAALVRALPHARRRAALADSGYLLPHLRPPHGRGADPVEQLVIEEEFAGIDRPRLSITGWVIATVDEHGDESQRARWLPDVLVGRTRWCQLFSEPDAGSDGSAVRTRAVRDESGAGGRGPGWRVTGQKVWTSGAGRADYGLATVRTGPGTQGRVGLSAVVIDLHAPGVTVRGLREITGEALFDEVFLDDVFVPDEDVVGAVGQGWTIVRATLAKERISLGSGAGPGVSAADLLGEPGASDAPAQTGDLLATEHAIAALGTRSAARAVAGLDRGDLADLAKLAAAEHGQAVAEAGMRFAGTAAVSGGAADTATRYLFSRCLTIGGGTSEILRTRIADRRFPTERAAPA